MWLGCCIHPFLLMHIIEIFDLIKKIQDISKNVSQLFPWIIWKYFCKVHLWNKKKLQIVTKNLKLNFKFLLKIVWIRPDCWLKYDVLHFESFFLIVLLEICCPNFPILNFLQIFEFRIFYMFYGCTQWCTQWCTGSMQVFFYKIGKYQKIKLINSKI